MQLGVLSDTHDAVETTLRVLALIKDEGIRTVVHCGDWKSVATAEAVTRFCSENSMTLYGVLGNNDADVDGFVRLATEFASRGITIVEGSLAIPAHGSSVVAYHGHHAPTLKRLRTDPSIDILLVGHTHKPNIENDEKLIVNPGSLAFAIPRSKQWRASYAIVDTATRSAILKYL